MFRAFVFCQIVTGLILNLMLYYVCVALNGFPFNSDRRSLSKYTYYIFSSVLIVMMKMLMIIILFILEHVEDQGCFPFALSIWVEILGENIQCCSLFKRKMEISQNVLVSIIGKYAKKRKNAPIKPVAYNFRNVSNGMVCTLSCSNQNFQVFLVNGKCPRFLFSLKPTITIIDLI